MHTYEFRDGDIVEVSPGRRDGYLIKPFLGVVDFRHAPARNRTHHLLDWVWVSTEISMYPGGWYAEQCRLIARPEPEPALPIPSNIELGSE